MLSIAIPDRRRYLELAERFFRTKGLLIDLGAEDEALKYFHAELVRAAQKAFDAGGEQTACNDLQLHFHLNGVEAAEFVRQHT